MKPRLAKAALLAAMLLLAAGEGPAQPAAAGHGGPWHTIERASVASDGAQANLYSFRPSISGDGRYVAFFSGATNLVLGDTNVSDDVFVAVRQHHPAFIGPPVRVPVETPPPGGPPAGGRQRLR